TKIAPTRTRSQCRIGRLHEFADCRTRASRAPPGRAKALAVRTPDCSCNDGSQLSGLSAILNGEIEGKDPVRSAGALQHLRIAKRANRIAVASLPVFLHRAAGKLVILGITFVILGAVDELYEIVDFLVCELRQLLGFRRMQQFLG